MGQRAEKLSNSIARAISAFRYTPNKDYDRAIEPFFDAQWLAKGDFVERRVQPLTNKSLDEFEVRTSLQFSSLAPGLLHLLPLGMIPKGLYSHFDVRSAEGSALPIVTSIDDSALAARFLVESLDSPWEDTPATVRAIITAHVASLVRSTDQTVEKLLTAARADRTVAQWVENFNIQNPRFMRTLAILADYYVPFVLARPRSDRLLVKCVRTEPILTPVSPDTKYPAKTLRFRVPDMCWATSEHIRIAAPSGTILTDAKFLQSLGESRRIGYQGQTTPSDAVLYARKGPISDQTFEATIWPQIQGFIRPAVRMMILIPMLLLLGVIGELAVRSHYCLRMFDWSSWDTFWSSPSDSCSSLLPLWSLRDTADAAVTLVFGVSLTILAYVYRDDSSRVRESLTREWRLVAVAAIVPAWLACAVLLIPRSAVAPHFVWIAWSILGLVSLGLLWLAKTWERRVNRAKGTLEITLKNNATQLDRIFTGLRTISEKESK